MKMKMLLLHSLCVGLCLCGVSARAALTPVNANTTVATATPTEEGWAISEAAVLTFSGSAPINLANKKIDVVPSAASPDFAAIHGSVNASTPFTLTNVVLSGTGDLAIVGTMGDGSTPMSLTLNVASSSFQGNLYVANNWNNACTASLGGANLSGAVFCYPSTYSGGNSRRSPNWSNKAEFGNDTLALTGDTTLSGVHGSYFKDRIKSNDATARVLTLTRAEAPTVRPVFAGTVENTLSKVTVSGAAKQEFSGIFNAALLEVSGTATAIFKKVPALTVTATTAKIAPSAGSVMEVTGALTLPGSSSTAVPIDFTGITVSSDFVPLLRTSVAGLTCSTALPEGTMWVDVPEGATHIYGLLPTANVYTATVSGDCTWESLNWTYSGGSVTSASLPTTAVLQMNVTGTPTITVSAPAVKVVSMVLSAPVTFAYNGAIPATTFESVFPGRSVNYPLFNFPVTGAFSWTYSGASTPAGFEITGGEHLTIALSSWVRTSSINVSFYRDAGIASQNLNSSDNANSNHGAFSIKGANWKDIKPLTMGATALKKVNADGTVTVDGSGTLAVANGNDAWRVHSEYAPQDNLLRGYIADFTNPTLTFANIPFAKFRVIVYFSAAEKSKSFNFVKINNVDYCGAADAVGGATIKGTSPWGKSTNGDTVLALKEGVNYLISDTLTSPTFTIAYTPSGSSALETGSGIAGIQIVEVTAEVKGIYTREAGSSGDWSAAKWTKDGTVSTVWTNATETVPTYATIDVANAQSLALTADVSATSVAVSGTGNLALTGTGALQTSFFDATKLNGTLTLGTTGLLTTVVDTGADATVALETTADRTYSSAFLLRGAGKFKKIGEGTATIATPSCPILL
ncbi:MAG: hypothetical protein RR982_01580, partial [Kiritimatiellia bacterium]